MPHSTAMLKVINTTRGTTVGDNIQLADTSFRRAFGLLGRSSLAAGEGLWIKPSSGVHTVGMSFAIDVVGLDRNNRIVKLWRSLVPFRLTSVSLKVRSVIELRSGAIGECDLHLGDELRIDPSPATSPA